VAPIDLKAVGASTDCFASARPCPVHHLIFGPGTPKKCVFYGILDVSLTDILFVAIERTSPRPVQRLGLSPPATFCCVDQNLVQSNPFARKRITRLLNQHCCAQNTHHAPKEAQTKARIGFNDS